MDVSGLDALLAEVTDDRPAVLTIMEGLVHKLEQADLAVGTRQSVEALQTKYLLLDDRLVTLRSQLSETRATVMQLLELGWPELPKLEIDDAAIADLDQNLESIVAARGQFKRRVVTTGGTSTVSEEEPVPTP